MELSEAGKVLQAAAKQYEACRSLGEAISTAIDAANSTAKASLQHQALLTQIESANKELSELKAQQSKQKAKLAADAEKAVQELNMQLAARQAEADDALQPVLAKLKEARAAYAKELAEHEEAIANMVKQKADLTATNNKLVATIEKLKAAVQNV